MRILGIDLGEKRIGISISDELGITAQGLPTINSINENEDLKNIKKIIDKYQVEKIIFFIFFKSSFSLIELIVGNPWAVIPNSSLIEIPILFSPKSIPKIRNMQFSN